MIKPHHMSERERVRLTASCRDCDGIPKHPHAGSRVDDPDGSAWQIMHNGIPVKYGGYYGEWMADIIRGLKGHHEPQEELLFWNALKRLGPSPNMIELGSFWAYYSLWLKKERPDGLCFMFEPDPAHLEVGRLNFARNGFSGHFELAASGLEGEADVYIESTCETRRVTSRSVDAICAEQGIQFLDLLHLDIQGAELAALRGAQEMVQGGNVRFVFVSTHHHRISGDPLTHQKCLDWLAHTGAHIVCEHAVHESFSGDGLIVASYGADEKGWEVDVSRARASESFFRELEYDLAEAL